MLNTILTGDAIEQLKLIPNDSVDMCITSPPYWQLRDYNIEGQIGLESSIDAFLESICAVFDSVKEKLHKTGSLYVNINDTYSGSGKGYGDKNSDPKFRYGGRDRNIKPPKTGIKDKSLCLIPERFAIKMVDRGWILRNVLIWHKPNAMPESVQDRFTRDYEYIYFFTKTGKYYHNQQYEPMTEDFKRRLQTGWNGNEMRSYVAGKQNNLSKYFGKTKEEALALYEKGRKKRSVWTIGTRKEVKAAHFATYPEKLVETPILASCPPNGIVLDPFIGSGTTAIVARNLGRNYIGIELNPEYTKIAEDRLKSSTFQQELIP